MALRGKKTKSQLYWLVPVVVMMFLTSGAEAAITLANGKNITFDSMPATFGMTWVSNVEYRARLLYLPGDPFLCDGILADDTITAADDDDDDLPIAVLASRGGCSFEEKARVAMNLKNVTFVIVYDDRKRTRLVPMSSHSGSAADVSVGMLFVSESTGDRKFPLAGKSILRIADHLTAESVERPLRRVCSVIYRALMLHYQRGVRPPLRPRDLQFVV